MGSAMATTRTLSVAQRRGFAAINWTRVGHHATERSLDVLLIVLVLFMVGPVLFLLISSFKTREEVTSGAALLPSTWMLSNYADMWGRVRFGTFLLNSLVICGSTTVIATLLASLTGYALARFRFPGADFFSLSVLGTQLIPGTLFLIPLFLTFLTIRNVT